MDYIFAFLLGTQVIVYVSDPEAAMQGKSNCPPCNRLCQDLKQYKTNDGRYIIGTEDGAFFRLVKSKGAVPVIRYPNGSVVTGYDGNHVRLIVKHPLRGRIYKR